MSLKTVARRSLRKVGLERISHPSLVDLMRREEIDCVLDVGANNGHFGAEIREQGYKGRIVSFEPGSAVFGELSRRSAGDALWAIHRAGLGNEDGELEISIMESDVFSSFKTPSDYTSQKFGGAKVERREKVPVLRLDSFLHEHPHALTPNTYLKVDTQGFEIEVLEGAGDLLNRFCVIQMELPLRLLYEGQKSFSEMLEWMAERGFEIGMAKENGFDWQDCRLLELDVAFVRSGEEYRRPVLRAT
jgi:FkbM family methyltransferase